jgi:hypothetical protein
MEGVPKHKRRNIQLVRLANGWLDRLLGISPDEVLNSGAALPVLDNPSQALKRSADAMRVSAVDPETGKVDYGALADSKAYSEFRRLTRSLPLCRLEDMGDRQSLMAFWINLYNALILDAVVSYGVSGTLQDQLGIFRQAAYNVGGMRFSADDIEHGVLRGNRRNPFLPFAPFGRDDPRLEMALEPIDPRVHFALVCGARSCPPIAFYDGTKLDAQLESACINFINAGGAEYDSASRTLGLSRILRWYQRDFGGRRGVLELTKKCTHDDELRSALEAGRVRIRYMRYDWTLNAA